MTSIKVAFRDYLVLEKNYSLHTQKAYCDDVDAFEAFLQDASFEVILEKVAYSHIRSWVVFLVDSGLSTVSVNRKIASLKAFYKFLLKTKQISVSPLLKHRALKVSKNIQIPFSEKEMNSLDGVFSADADFDSLRDRLMIEMFYATGMRRAEIINLRCKDVNVGAATIKVLGKRNKERIVPMLSMLAGRIELYLKERSNLEELVDFEYFFVTSKGLKLSQSFVYRTINLYFSNVSEKVKKSPHVLRHTFATHMLNNGADLNSIKELLGHSSLASTQVYTNSSLSELKKVYKDAHPRSLK
ncbi:Integrase, site-specific recombinase [Flavobacterium sp. 9R]|uniref:tyrosine-type recombinase/integrase n=1 Tax=Flavobacterium sp. 9R TaxID=2653143 RepID=UPI0012F09464|nr:tyrosine-type recombinase/integrase [Flavobacterium sp. 9R]VXA92566.1 Integrase, site-specific recombinase [Flavobacterium sp. 9R]